MYYSQYGIIQGFSSHLSLNQTIYSIPPVCQAISKIILYILAHLVVTTRYLAVMPITHLGASSFIYHNVRIVLKCMLKM
jgi:hypothetical protein